MHSSFIFYFPFYLPFTSFSKFHLFFSTILSKPWTIFKTSYFSSKVQAIFLFLPFLWISNFQPYFDPACNFSNVQILSNFFSSYMSSKFYSEFFVSFQVLRHLLHHLYFSQKSFSLNHSFILQKALVFHHSSNKVGKENSTKQCQRDEFSKASQEAGPDK